MTLLFRAIAPYISLALLSFAPCSPALAQSDDRPRIIIVDASGSMVAKDFRGGKSRWEAALFQVRNYMDQLLSLGDRRPTALITFGHEQSWDQASEEYKTKESIKIPAGTAYCLDVEVMARPAPMSAGRADRFMSMLDLSRTIDGGPSGMTPIIQSLREAAALMEKDVGGEILIVSDWARVNCVPKNKTFCEWVEDVFEGFREKGGTVELRYIFVDPNRTDVSPPNALQKCVPNDSSATEDDPENTEPAEKLNQQVPVDFVLDFGGRIPVNLPSNHLAGSGLEVSGPTVNGTGIRHKGALGRVVLFPGDHEYAAQVFPGSDAFKRIKGTYKVTTGGAVLLGYNAPLLAIRLENHSGEPLNNLDVELTFEYAGNSSLNYRSPSPVRSGLHGVVLLPGTYRVTAMLGQQATQGSITLVEGQDSELALVLDARPGVSGGANLPTPPGNNPPRPPSGNNATTPPSSNIGTTTQGSTVGTASSGGSRTTNSVDSNGGISLTIELIYGKVDLFADNALTPQFKLGEEHLSIGQNMLDASEGRQVIVIREGTHQGQKAIMIGSEPIQTQSVSINPGWIYGVDALATSYDIEPVNAPGLETVQGGRLHVSLPAGNYQITAWRGNDVIGTRDVTVTPNSGSLVEF